MLPSNYRLTFSGTSGEKPLGQLSVLTCSERVQVSGPLNAEDPKTVFEISGTLSEKEGSLVFTYSIGFSVLIQPPEAAAGERLGNARPGNANASYVNHSASGSLRIKPGEVYEVLKSGGNAYTVSISPETKP